MDIEIKPGKRTGAVNIISSKSFAHRILLCAALADKKTFARINGVSQDVDATLNCLKTMGCAVNPEAGGVTVTPFANRVRENTVINCGESGTLARFVLPLAAHLYESFTLTGEGSLLSRPFAPICQTLAQAGCEFDGDTLPIRVKNGKGLTPGAFYIAGDISSQFISGLLLTLPLLSGNSEIILTSPLQSSAYVDMTIQTQNAFGIEIEKTATGFSVKGNQKYLSPGEMAAEGDWSNAAFFLCMNALGSNISVNGLADNSLQGDRAVTGILNEFKTKTNVEIDAAQIPDLIPVLSVVAAARRGTTRVINAERLRIKESDRLQTTFNMLTGLGADVTPTPDGLIINGGSLRGGTVNGENDHRIVMAAATAACACESPVVIKGCEAVNKSYPNFFEVYACLPLLAQT